MLQILCVTYGVLKLFRNSFRWLQNVCQLIHLTLLKNLFRISYCFQISLGEMRHMCPCTLSYCNCLCWGSFFNETNFHFALLAASSYHWVQSDSNFFCCLYQHFPKCALRTTSDTPIRKCSCKQTEMKIVLLNNAWEPPSWKVTKDISILNVVGNPAVNKNVYFCLIHVTKFIWSVSIVTRKSWITILATLDHF